MAAHDVQIILKHVSGLPRDHFVNTLHFEVNAPDTLEGLCDDLNAAYQAFSANFAQDVNGMEVRVYEPGPNPSGPKFAKAYTTPTGGTSNAPGELAVCLSYAATDDPDAALARRRGRIFIGPLNGTLANAVRPSTTLRSAVLALGQSIASAGNAGNTTWLMRSAADNSYHKIESIWVDDAWDIQRRRGLQPTLRDVQDVQ